MGGHFNKLTPAQAERLAILAEECGEVIQVVGKILRHGYSSYHPVTDIRNDERLAEEIGDVKAAVEMLCSSGDISRGSTEVAMKDKLVRVKKYMHHLEQ